MGDMQLWVAQLVGQLTVGEADNLDLDAVCVVGLRSPRAVLQASGSVIDRDALHQPPLTVLDLEDEVRGRPPRLHRLERASRCRRVERCERFSPGT
jgi:hypothetical protein